MVQLARVALELQDAGEHQKVEAAKVGGLEPDMACSAWVALSTTRNLSTLHRERPDMRNWTSVPAVGFVLL